VFAREGWYELHREEKSEFVRMVQLRKVLLELFRSVLARRLKEFETWEFLAGGMYL
jgi:hypothetical protein